MSLPASRLDRMIARLSTQRAYLEHAVGLVGDRPGPVLEIGLGKGRTYDHLRRLVAPERIFAFDGSIHAPPDSVPPASHMRVGDFRETLAAMQEQFGGRAVLAHADFGSEDGSHDKGQAVWLAPLIDALMAPGGLVVSDRRLDAAGWQALPPLADQGWPYHLWQVAR